MVLMLLCGGNSLQFILKFIFKRLSQTCIVGAVTKHFYTFKVWGRNPLKAPPPPLLLAHKHLLYVQRYIQAPGNTYVHRYIQAPGIARPTKNLQIYKN